MSEEDPKPLGRIATRWGWTIAGPRPFFVWKDTFAMGESEVDEEHRHFFEMANWLRSSMIAGEGQAAARQALLTMEEHARCHFGHEEACLVAAECPYLVRHRNEHRQFALAVAHLLDQRAPSPEAAFCLARGWILDHILHTDRQHKAWMPRPVRPRGSRPG